MKLYTCERCCKIFKQKSHYDAHKNRKFQCLQKDSNIAPIAPIQNEHYVQTNTQNELQPSSQLEKNITCNYCNANFRYKKNLTRHLDNRCKIKKQINAEKESIYNRLLSELHAIKKSNSEILKENKRLHQKIQKIETYQYVTNNKTINNGNIITNNVKLVAYGKEDRSKLDPTAVLRAIQGYATEIELTKLIHFNDKHPEYYNIYINNLRDKYVMVYDGGEWKLKLRDGIIDDIYDTNKEYVEEKLDEFIKKLDRSRINSLKRWLATDNSNPTDQKIKKIKDELKLLLYNEKERVIKQIEPADMPLMIAD